MEFAQCHTVEIDLNDGPLGRDARVIRERRSQRENGVALIHKPTGNGSSRTTKHAGSERMVVGDLPLGFERCQYRRVQTLREFNDLVHRIPCTVADDYDGSLRFLEQRDRLVQSFHGRRNMMRRKPAIRTGGFGVLGSWQGLHVIRKNQV